jgi:2-polyprenyl-6-methoxyphenol hydroxylase-like FAD-dependent oxidoreductase
MDVLISGAGIAGPCLAWWLLRQGHAVTLVEKAAKPRTGGYIIDFWGKGYDLAERMGLMPQIQAVGYHVNEVRFVGDDGRRRGGFDVGVFDRATGGRFVTLPRGELARVLFEAVGNGVEALFGDEISAFEQDAGGVTVSLASGAERRCDLLIGTEGIHSRTRDLAFGPEGRFERFLGYSFAAYTIPGYPQRDPNVYVMHGEPGRQAARFALRDGTTLALLIWRDEAGMPAPHEPARQRAMLRERFAGGAWEVSALLAGLDQADDLYLDRMSQIRMDRWHHGRVALLGDAAFAPSFLAGQGSALAMIGGYVLAGELSRAGGDVLAALAAYEQRLMGFMRGKQDAAKGMASYFVPHSRFGLAVRAAVSRLLGVGWFADLLIGRSLRDRVDLPEYG